MQVYVYQADIYCADCGEAICGELDKQGFPRMENWDSDEYPKGPYPNGGGEADCPQHCGSGGECVNAIEIPDRIGLSETVKIGAFLGNPLTADGVKYVQEARCEESGEIVDLWANWYRDALDA